jgi:hypothetical protein
MISPLSNKPKITQSDIDRTYVMRHFVQNTSTKQIVEVDKRQYEIFKTKAFYVLLDFKWVITGEANNITAIDGTTIYGTRHKNQTSIEWYNRRMPGLNRILVNPLEFFYGTITEQKQLPKKLIPQNNSVYEIIPPPTTTTTTTAFSCTCRTYQVSNFTGFTQQYDYYDCNNILNAAVTILNGETQQVCVCNDRIQYSDRALIVTLISGTCITTTTSTTTTAYTGCDLAGVACEQTTTTTTSSSTSTTTTSSTSTTTTSSTSTSTTSTTTTAFDTNCTFYQIQPIESISIEWEDCGTGTPLSGTYISTQNICANTGTLNVTNGTGVITIVGPC